MNKVLNNYRLVLKKMEATQKKFSPAPPHTKLIVVTHTYGNMNEIEEICRFAKQKKIYVLEDCAESLGSIYNKKQSSFKNADQIHYKGIYLPINADLEEEDVLFVCNRFKEIARVY